jgi:uncharacterized damage-inducible protein DinB
MIAEEFAVDQNDRLLQHDRWMSNLMFDAAAKLDDASLDQDFEIGHRNVRATLDHITVGIEFWTTLMSGESGRWKPQPTDVETMQARQLAAYNEFERLSRQIITENRLDNTFIDPWECPQSMGGTILHVILHSHVHRSELLHMFQRLGFNEFTQGDPQEWEHMAGATAPLYVPAIVLSKETGEPGRLTD